MGLTPLEIWQKLTHLADKTGKSLNKASECTGVSSGTISDWKKSYPRLDKFAAVIEYYGASMDSIVFGKERVGNQEYSEDELKLIEEFRNLDERDKADIMGIIKMKLDYGKKDATLSSSGNA